MDASMFSLPQDILKEILDRLDVETLWVVAPKVCKAWQCLAMIGPQLCDWKSMPQITSPGAFKSALQLVVGRESTAYTVSSFSLPPSTFYSPYAKIAPMAFDFHSIDFSLCHFKRLRSLDFSSLRWKYQDSLLSTVFAQNAETLTRLVAPQMYLPSHQFLNFAAVLTNLEELDMSDNDISINNITSLTSLRVLKALDIRCENQLEDEGTLYGLTSLHQLTQLRLHGLEIERALFDVLKQLPSLKALFLPNHRITPKQLAGCVPSALTSFHVAVWNDNYRSQDEDEPFISCIHMLSVLPLVVPHLRAFTINLNDYWDEDHAAALQSFVASMPRLRHLHVELRPSWRRSDFGADSTMLLALSNQLDRLIITELREGSRPHKFPSAPLREDPTGYHALSIMSSKLSLLSQATTVGWAVWAFPLNEALEFVQAASPQDIDDGEWPAIWMCLARVDSSSILPILRALLERGASVTPRLPNNETLLRGVVRALLSSEDDCLDAISLLIERGVPLNTVDNLGISALYFAVQNSLDDVVQLLLNAGASAEPKGGHRPIQCARCERSLLALIEHGSSPIPLAHETEWCLEYAILGSHPQMVEKLLKDFKVDPNIMKGASHCWRSLAAAIQFNVAKDVDAITRMFTLLLESGASLLHTADKTNHNAIHDWVDVVAGKGLTPSSAMILLQLFLRLITTKAVEVKELFERSNATHGTIRRSDSSILSLILKAPYLTFEAIESDEESRLRKEIADRLVSLGCISPK